MEDFYYEENNIKQVFLKCLLIVFIIGISVGIFFYSKNKNTLKLKDITIDVGESLSKNVSDYIAKGNKFVDEYKLYLDNVDINKVGEYTYKVKYNKHIEYGTIKVIDNKKPIVEVNDIIIGKDEEINFDDLITSCIDDSLPCKVSFKRDKDINKLKEEGKYEIELIISDAVGNKTNSKVNITVSATETMSSIKTSDLKYYSNSEKDNSLDHTLFIKLDKAINEETLEYEGLIQELSSLDFNEYVEDKEIIDIKLITAYNKYNFVIGFQVYAMFNDGSSELLEKIGD